VTGRTALVVGGSVGGLMSAIALHEAGFTTTVFERSRAGLTGYGQGIRVQPAIHDFFAEVVGIDFVPSTKLLHERRFLDQSGAFVLSQNETGYTTHWNALHHALLQAYRGEYELGATAVGVWQAGDHAVVQFAEGHEARADLVIFADGINSIGRRQFSPGSTLDYAGYVAWRGTAPGATISEAAQAQLDAGLNIEILDGSHVHLYPVPGQDDAELLFNFVWYRNVAAGADLDDLLTDVHGTRRAISVPTGLLRPERIQEAFAAATRDLAPQVAAIINASTPSVQVIFDLESSRMAFGRIGILGDAAFVARPHLGAGTAKAAENALALIDALSANDVPAALEHWEMSQLALGHDLVARSRQLGQLYQFDGTYPGDPVLEAIFSDASMLARAPASPSYRSWRN
jgi:2,6-dihydroxypyridine 3-monooxygenase